MARQGVARVLKVDKHRPVHTEAKPSEDQQRRAAHSSASVRKGPNAPSERAPTQVRSSTATTSATAKKEELPTKPRGTVRGVSGNENRSGMKPSDAQTTPSVGAVRPKVETTTRPGLATVSVSIWPPPIFALLSFPCPEPHRSPFWELDYNPSDSVFSGSIPQCSTHSRVMIL